MYKRRGLALSLRHFFAEFFNDFLYLSTVTMVLLIVTVRGTAVDLHCHCIARPQTGVLNPRAARQ